MKKIIATVMAFSLLVTSSNLVWADSVKSAPTANAVRTVPASVNAAKTISTTKGAKAPSQSDLLVSQLDKLFIAAQKTSGFSGSVILSQKGKVLLNKGYGLANEEYKVPNGPKTIYRIASLSKQITAAAVLKLEEGGKLSLQDPLSKFIPDFPRGNEITLQMLLNHTSGLQDKTEHLQMDSVSLVRIQHSPMELVAMIKGEPLVTEPGKAYFYSNHGYILLGYVIEQASGTSYENFLRSQILEPLGISDIQYDQGDKIVLNRAEGYKIVNGIKQKSDFIDMSNPFAAGALIGTTESYLKWQQSYYSPKILTKASWDKLFNNGVKTNRTPLLNESYGLGIMMADFKMPSGQTSKISYHTGGVNGFRTFQIHMEKAGLDFVLMSNNESINLEAMIFGLLTIFMPHV